MVPVLIVAVIDLIQYLRGNDVILRSVGDWWFAIHKDSLLLAQPAIERHVLPVLWDPVVVTVLQWPLAVVIAVLGLLLALFLRRRQRRLLD